MDLNNEKAFKRAVKNLRTELKSYDLELTQAAALNLMARIGNSKNYNTHKTTFKTIQYNTPIGLKNEVESIFAKCNPNKDKMPENCIKDIILVIGKYLDVDFYKDQNQQLNIHEELQVKNIRAIISYSIDEVYQYTKNTGDLESIISTLHIAVNMKERIQYINDKQTIIAIKNIVSMLKTTNYN